MRGEWTPRGELRLRQCRDYILGVSQDPLTAYRFEDGIIDTSLQLADFTLSGRMVPEIRLRAHAPVREFQQLAHGESKEIHVLLLRLGEFPYHLVFRDAAVEQPCAVVVGAHELARRDEPDFSRFHFGFVFQAVLDRCHDFLDGNNSNNF